ncbi:ABC transporter permease [Tissierella praeacuta]|uniref:ABC transporter permease n=1 Tax=Tissierella praeacuta TaxID=43131 RepID=UPI003340AA76
MINSIKRQFKKIKNNNLMRNSILVILIFSLFIVFKDLFVNTSVSKQGIDKWIYSNIMICNFILLHTISIFFITFIVQDEYANRTIINYLPYLKHRYYFIMEKMIVWFVLHVIMTITTYLVISIGSLFIFKTNNIIERLFYIGIRYLRTCILGFMILSPVIISTIKQRESYLRSIIIGIMSIICSVTLIQLDGILPFILPWSASLILSTGIENPLSAFGLLSVIILFILSLLFSFRNIEKQDL